MITIKEIIEYLQTIIDCPYWYSYKMTECHKQSIGLYPSKNPYKKHLAIGGYINTSYATKSLTMLVHWGKNQNSAEIKALEIYKILDTHEGAINDCPFYILTRNSEPIYINTDGEGVHEFVIDFVIYYKRKD